MESGVAVLQDAGGSDERLIVRGRSNLLENDGTAEDLNRVRVLFDDLERKQDIVEFLNLTDTGEGVRIFIGSENKLFSLSGSSLVVSPYMNADRKVIGAVGVIGPTRLNYGRIVPIVNYTAQMVGRVLSDRSSVEMAMENEDDFLQDISLAEEEVFGEDEHTDEELELDELRAERDDLKDKWMRALADAENSRKRSERDRREAENYGGSKLARDLLPIYDNLKRGLESATDEQRAVASALIEGVELTMRELISVFKKHGIEPIVPEVGDKFNPQDHESMFEAPLPGTKSGEIIQVLSEGFMLHDRLLRPAQVGVSSMTD